VDVAAGEIAPRARPRGCPYHPADLKDVPIADISIDELKSLKRAGRLMPFVGAGLSQSLGLPLYDDLIGDVAVELGWDPEVFRLQGDYRQLAEYYVMMTGSIGPLRSALDKAWNPTDDDVKASRPHQALATLMPARIYTTNYDDIIERAFKLHNAPYHAIASIDDIASAASGVTQIVKYHGTFSDDSSLVLTESSYFDRLDFESALDIRLRSDSLGSCILFLGYSLQDINIRYMLYQLHKLRHRDVKGSDFPSAVLVTSAIGEVQEKLLESWNVRSVELQGYDMAENVATFLESL
jgi:hypothetical protein